MTVSENYALCARVREAMTQASSQLNCLWLKRRRAGEQMCPRCLQPSLLCPAARTARTETGKYMVFTALQLSPVTMLSPVFQNKTLLFLRQEPRRPGMSCQLSLHAGHCVQWIDIHLPLNLKCLTVWCRLPSNSSDKMDKTEWVSWRRRTVSGKSWKRAEMGYTVAICQKPWEGWSDSLLLKARPVFTNKRVCGHMNIFWERRKQCGTEPSLLKHQISLEGPSGGFISTENRRWHLSYVFKVIGKMPLPIDAPRRPQFSSDRDLVLSGCTFSRLLL